MLVHTPRFSLKYRRNRLLRLQSYLRYVCFCQWSPHRLIHGFTMYLHRLIRGYFPIHYYFLDRRFLRYHTGYLHWSSEWLYVSSFFSVFYSAMYLTVCPDVHYGYTYVGGGFRQDYVIHYLFRHYTYLCFLSFFRFLVKPRAVFFPHYLHHLICQFILSPPTVWVVFWSLLV